MSRTLAIGDVHGCLTALDTLLGFVQPRPGDHLVFLGDYIDRGPDSKGVLDRLIEIKRIWDVIFLRGNHEIMMAAAGLGHEVRFWLSCGGQQALESYARPNRIALVDDIPQSHWTFVQTGCLDWYETDTHIFVHANLHPDKPLNEQVTEWLHWQALKAVSHRPHVSGKTMVCGHTEQRNGEPLSLERAICIDTWVYGDGWLTCLDIGSGEYWQANELGHTRAGRLGLPAP